MAAGLIEKVCPVVVRGVGNAQDVLVFRHPLAGVQLVKGTREAGEPVVAGAVRELAEEAGITQGLTGALLCSSSAIVSGQLWHFVLLHTQELPERWVFETADDGGHRFAFFWWPLLAEPGADWHPDFVRALAVIRRAVGDASHEAAKLLSRYAQVINNHSFDDVAPLIAEDAVFWFGDGSHTGLPAIRCAFDATWGKLVDEIYWLEDVLWVAQGDDAASCVYRFHWQAIVDGESRSGAGRGTSVLARRAHGWRIVHEHLSGLPG